MRSTHRNVCLALALAALLSGSAAPARAQDDNPFGGGKTTKKLTVADLIEFKFSTKPEEVKRGEPFTLTITGTPKAGYHTYPVTQRSDDEEAQPESQLTKLTYGEPSSFKPLWPVTESPPKSVAVPKVGTMLEHEHKFTWSQDIYVLPGAAPGRRSLPLTIKLSVCDENSCRDGKIQFTVPVTISSAEAVAPTAELQARLDAKAPPTKVVPKDAPAPRAVEGPPAPGAAPPGPPKGEQPEAARNNPTPPTPPVAPAVERKESSLWGLLAASIGAALLMLFTPCVFPMIPITVSFFLKQSEKEHHRPVATAGVYCLTIIVVLALAVLVLGQLIVKLANSPWLNLGLGVLLVVFALSLFGMYEIELPHFIARFTSTREGRGGYAGTFFMALTFTVTSFSCTGPFLGPLLVTAKEMQLSLDRLIIASFAYSATFAAPFFVMALFPSMLKKLPRSGGWLNSVKVVMGFLELAAALKFLGNMDVAMNPGNPRFFTFEAVLCAWIALSAACGLYLFGAFRLPHDSPVTTIGVPRMVLATLFFGLALFMVPALFGKVPQGALGEWVLAIAPLDTSRESSSGGTAIAQAGPHWYEDYQVAWEQATKENKPIFIDFTGVNCPNCRKNENGVFPRKDVREELTKFVCVRLYNDFVPRAGLTQDQAEAEAQRNRDLQAHTFDDIATPMYAVIHPDKSRPFDGDKFAGQVADPRRPVVSGVINDPADFVNFLKRGQEKQVALAGR